MVVAVVRRGYMQLSRRQWSCCPFRSLFWNRCGRAAPCSSTRLAPHGRRRHVLCAWWAPLAFACDNLYWAPLGSPGRHLHTGGQTDTRPTDRPTRQHRQQTAQTGTRPTDRPTDTDRPRQTEADRDRQRQTDRQDSSKFKSDQTQSNLQKLTISSV